MKAPYSSIRFSVSYLLLIVSVLTSQAQVLQKEIAGKYAVELWNDSGYGYDVKGLVKSQKFYQAPDVKQTKGSRFANLGSYVGLRMRAYLTAPESGNYVFWVSAKSSGQIWLSSDASKYRKELLCYLGSDSGSGTTGVPQNSSNLWDQYATQMSKEVYLEAGERYYLEALGKAGHAKFKHLSLAWATPSGGRTLIPASALKSYVLEAEDGDDDFLPDAWETQHGLDSTDNGLISPDLQGERGDYDNDGLNNREEYVLGLNPANSDSDGDGLSDGEEVHNYLTDPNVSDAPSENIVNTLDLTQFTADNGLNWAYTSQGYIPSQFRGATSWSFAVPSDGHWMINAYTKLIGDLYLTETINFDISIDGGAPQSQSVTYGNNAQGTLRYLTPFLSAGSHTITINIDNLIARRMVSLLEIQVLEPLGTDLNSDGIPDWVHSQIQGENTIFPYLSSSRTTPAFIEGYASDRATVLVNGAPPLAGVDLNHWYANVDLEESATTDFDVQLTSRLSESPSIQWGATNILDGESLTIRQGDKLKLVARPSSGISGNSTDIQLPLVNVATNSLAKASQSTTAYRGHAFRAIDGNKSGKWANNSTTLTKNKSGSWWKVNLGGDYEIHSVNLWNRIDSLALKKRLSNYRISILNSAGNIVISKDFYRTSGFTDIVEKWTLPAPVMGRTVKVQKLGRSRVRVISLSLAEVEVLANIGTQTLASDASHLIFECEQAGVQTITASHSNGETGTLTIDVKKASFSDTPQDFIVNNRGVISLNNVFVSSDIYMDGGERVIAKPQSSEGVYNVFCLDNGLHNIAARLYEGGPILDTKPLNFYGVSGASQNDMVQSFLSRDFTGYQVITSPVVVTDLPDGGYVKIVINRAGVSFKDGRLKRVLRAEDFKNGIHVLEFLFPQGLAGGFCHDIKIYDRNGVYIGSR